MQERSGRCRGVYVDMMPLPEPSVEGTKEGMSMSGSPITASISVAMATYNGERFLREQLDSLNQQTVLPRELVVCDDRSTDKTVRILEEFASQAAFPVKVVVNENRLGFGDNFMKAASLCSGDLISFCDQDDIWYSNKIEVSRDLLLQHDAVLCAHDADLCDEHGTVTGRHVSGVQSGVYEPLGLNPWGVFFGFTCTFRRDLLETVSSEHRPEDDRNAKVRLAHDRWIYFLSNCFGRTVYSTLALAKYRQHATNVFSSRGKVSFLNKTHKLLNEYDIYIKKYQRLIDARTSLLDDYRNQCREEHRASVDNAHKFWKTLGALQRSRADAIFQTSMLKRFWKISQIRKQGGYRPVMDGGLGRQAMVEDLVGASTRTIFSRHDRSGQGVGD